MACRWNQSESAQKKTNSVNIDHERLSLGLTILIQI